MVRRIVLAIGVILGVIAGILGGYHGYGEIQQGSASPPGIVINAFGGPNCPAEVDPDCFPAMTILPTSFSIIGTITVLVALLTILSTVTLVLGRDNGKWLLLSSIVLLLVGGGFLPPVLGMVGAAAGYYSTRE